MAYIHGIPVIAIKQLYYRHLHLHILHVKGALYDLFYQLICIKSIQMVF